MIYGAILFSVRKIFVEDYWSTFPIFPYGLRWRFPKSSGLLLRSRMKPWAGKPLAITFPCLPWRSSAMRSKSVAQRSQASPHGDMLDSSVQVNTADSGKTMRYVEAPGMDLRR